MHQVNRGLVVVALLGAVGIGVGIGASLPDQIARSYAAEDGVKHDGLTHVDEMAGAFKSVAKALHPTVVSISSLKRVDAARVSVPGRPELPPEFRRFFDDDLMRRFFENQQLPRGGIEQKGLGSGVVIRHDGYIATNNHVVQGATEVSVTLADGRMLPAEIVGTDAKTDLAVLKIDADGLVPARLADSDAVEVGEWVLAIGNPFELHHTVTAGIVSAKGRAPQITDYEDFLQTDAAINPGNSGGPLVNLRGEVIGINTAIASRNGGNMGVGFAIPSNMVRMVTESIIADGRVERGQLGALIQDLTEDLARSFGYESTQGVLIGDVLPDSAAQQAGLQAGDIVLEYSGETIRSANQLRNEVAATRPGTQTTLVVFRDGKRRTLRVSIGQLNEQPSVAAARGAAASGLGLTVQTLDAQLAERLGYPADQSGAVVTEVEPGSLAARFGIRSGDVIVGLDRREVASADDFRAAAQNLDLGQGVRLQVMRDGVRRFLFLREGR